MVAFHIVSLLVMDETVISFTSVTSATVNDANANQYHTIYRNSIKTEQQTPKTQVIFDDRRERFDVDAMKGSVCSFIIIVCLHEIELCRDRCHDGPSRCVTTARYDTS